MSAKKPKLRMSEVNSDSQALELILEFCLEQRFLQGREKIALGTMLSCHYGFARGKGESFESAVKYGFVKALQDFDKVQKSRTEEEVE